MNTLQMLTLRRNASLGRLAALGKRAERLGEHTAPLVRAALQELSTSLEEVEVATEQLQMQLEELGGVKGELLAITRRFAEFLDVLPVACVWTNVAGEIDQANAAAAELLNVSAARLAGRRLGLFATGRQEFEDALTALNQGIARVIEFDAVLRPRERRPRRVHVVGRSLSDDPRRCWFFTSAPAAADIEA